MASIIEDDANVWLTAAVDDASNDRMDDAGAWALMSIAASLADIRDAVCDIRAHLQR